MSETTTGSLKAIFKFPFQGQEWQSRFVIGSVLYVAGLFIPVLPLIFVAGYLVQIYRKAIHGEELALPAWADWGRLAIDGLRMSVVSLVYLLPGTAVLLGGYIAYLAAITVISFQSTGYGAYGDPGAASALILGGVAALLIGLFLGLLLTVLGAIPLPFATAHFVARDRVGAALHVREWWAILRRNKLDYMIAWVLVYGLGSILYVGIMLLTYTLCLCCLVPIVAGPILFYLSLVCAAVFGRTYGETAAALAPGQGQEPAAG